MKNRSITSEIKKVIAILQNLDGKKIWNLSCIISGMGILNAHVEDASKMVLKMEKKSLMDFVQKMSPEEYKAKIGASPSQAQPAANAQTQPIAEAKAGVEDQIKKLDELEKAIEQEKNALIKDSTAKKGKKVAKNK